VLKRTLSFTVVDEAELVHSRIVDGPGMAYVPLLKSLVSYRSEAGHISARRLELGKWRHQMVIVKVVIEAEVLAAADSMIKADSELITPLRLNRCGHQFIGAVGGNRNILQQVNSSRIQTAERNDVPREQIRVELTIRDIRG